MSYPFYTIGHSTRPVEAFVEFLREAQVQLVVDVRTVPRSRTNPQYNLDLLPETLLGFRVGYEHIPALGGLRPNNNDVPSTVNGYWLNRSFHNYADYAMTDEFRVGLERLSTLGHARCCAIMCAEAVWWRCHRRIIADYLIQSGETVFHILSARHIERAHISVAAHPGPDHTLTYPSS
jgi:uncharacterized protein (DUF488 family)